MKQIFRIILLQLCFLSSLGLLHSQINAEVEILTDEPLNGKLKPELFGGFIELLLDFVNGPFGLWAQELSNRGFDSYNVFSSDISENWNKYTSGDISETIWTLVSGGFNENGMNCQRIEKNNSFDESGIYQNIILTNGVESDFYIYLRGDIYPSEVKISLMDKNLTKTLNSQHINNITENWTKYELKLPAISGESNVCLVISFVGIGWLEMDEASLMHSNNVNGIRKELFDYYKMWKCGSLRYPGGWFAESAEGRWKYGIGNIDKRKSPNGKQRIDFGTDEYIIFCKAIGALPFIVVNTNNATSQEAAEWVEYCNGDIETYYGRIRAENGSTEPFNVIYWEVGNENYDDHIEMAKRHIIFYDAMKAVDSNIKIIINGNTFGDSKKIFQEIVDIAGDKFDIYGWHSTQSGYSPANPPDEEIFKVMAAGNHNLDNNISMIYSWVIDNGLSQKVKLACTEWWNNYNVPNVWDDSNIRMYSLESGIWNAGLMLSFMRHPSTFVLSNKTSGFGMMKMGMNSESYRVHYAMPSYWALQMLANHSGNIVLNYIRECPSYNTKPYEMLWQFYDVPYIDLTVTASQDSMYIAVINRNHNESVNVKLNYGFDISGLSASVCELSSNHFLDVNVPDSPENIKPKYKLWNVGYHYLFPKHSLTIISIPCDIYSTSTADGNINHFVFYPNPVRRIGFLKIQNDLIDDLGFSFIDILGVTRNIEMERINENLYQFDFSGLPAGIYYLKCMGNVYSRVIPILHIE